ncbi:hypothetical protein FRC08_003030 [Ceratobasidium sp. 394]|nr:hypothetical protein FRC08_003030 [Ceratobasidium sp. 394]
MAETTWGPVVEEYTRHDFNPRPSDILDIHFHETRQPPPLAAVENSLCTCNPKAANPGEMSAGAILEALRKYTQDTNDCKVFKYYYGFLCIRHLLHIICLAVLEQTHTPDTFLESLRQGTIWSDISIKATALESLKRMGQATKNAASFDIFCRKFIVSGPTKDFNASGASLIASLLWQDRDSFLALCSQGLLPGCALLLLVSLKLLSTNSGIGR